MAFYRSVILVGCLLFGLSNCTTCVQKTFEYRQKNPIPLQAAGIKVLYDIRATDLDYTVSKPLSEAVEKWLSLRLSPIGTQGIGILTVKEAKIQFIPNDRFPDKCEGKLTANFNIINVQGMPVFQMQASVSKQYGINVPVDKTTRRHITDNMVKDLINAFDQQMEMALVKPATLPIK